MKFWTLFKKEWYEARALFLIVILVVLVFGGASVREKIPRLGSEYRSAQQGKTTISPYELTVSYPFRDIGGTLVFLSVLLGLKLGISQIWVPNYTKTWPFLIHRSVRRDTILGAQLLCALLGLVVCMGGAWSIVFWYGTSFQYQYIGYVNWRILVEGWILLGYGVIAYLVTALAGLLPGTWFSIRFFGLVWGMLTLSLMAMQWQLTWALGVWALGAGLLLLLLWDGFRRREFS